MKAFALESPDKPAGVIDVPKPAVGHDDILIAVRAASVNGFDVYQASGYLFAMMEHDFPTVIGRDFAGVVEEVGPGRADFARGDEVFGFIPSVPPLKSGAFAEYVAGGHELVLARKPAEIDFDEAAALPLAGSAALDLLEAIDGREGDVVLIVGATGGVGTIAIQLAARRGLRVVATARPDEEAALVRGLGATDTIDYSGGSIADAVRSRYPDGVAALIDVVDRNDALTELASVVRPRPASRPPGAADIEQLEARGLVGHNVNATPTPEKLRLLAELATSGASHVQIQAVFPLDRAGEAIKAHQVGTRVS